MATLYLMVGLPCSGKTTKAKELENELLALRLTPDEWHVKLFGHDIADPEHDKRHYLIEDMLWQIAHRALSLGTNIILDFGFWAKEERDDYRARAQKLGTKSEIVWMDVEAEELMRRVRLRNENLTNTIHYIQKNSCFPRFISFKSQMQMNFYRETDEFLLLGLTFEHR